MIPTELIIAAGMLVAFCLGFIACGFLSARRQTQAYRAGRTDMEKLIRDRAVVDFRDRQNLSH
jgi:hypothetical protein